MKKLLIINIALILMQFTQAQTITNLDEEKGISNIKLGRYYLDYRVKLEYFGELDNQKIYTYLSNEKILFRGIYFDELLLFFDANDRLVKISLTKFCNKSLSDECFNGYTGLLKACILAYSNQFKRKDYEEIDSSTFSTTWTGNEVVLEVFYTLYKANSTPDDISVFFSFK